MAPKPNKFRKPCTKCKELFKPTGKYSKICDLCIENKKNLKIKALINQKMRYVPKIILCPYKTLGGYCVHKGTNGKLCHFNNIERCEEYNEWLELRKINSRAVETPKEAITE